MILFKGIRVCRICVVPLSTMLASHKACQIVAPFYSEQNKPCSTTQTSYVESAFYRVHHVESCYLLSFVLPHLLKSSLEIPTKPPHTSYVKLRTTRRRILYAVNFKWIPEPTRRRVLLAVTLLSMRRTFAGRDISRPRGTSSETKKSANTDRIRSSSSGTRWTSLKI